jgi:hypothetical protein
MRIQIDSNFPGGAVEGIFFENEHTVFFEAPLNGSPQSLWYYFRITGGKGEPLTFVQRNLANILGVLESRTYQFTNPVIKHGESGSWERINSTDVIFTKDPMKYTFVVTPQNDVTYLAFSFPYTFENLKGFIESNDEFNNIKIGYSGKTSEGRRYPYLEVGNPEIKGKYCILITARHHAGETPGSYVLEGILKSFLHQLNLANSKIGQLKLFIFPFVDFDGVQEGRYGKGRPPIDFNRDWSAKSQHQEILQIQEFTENALIDHQLLLYIDLHAPQPGGTSYLIPPRASCYQSELYYRMWNFSHQFEKEIEGVTTCRVEDLDPFAMNWGQENYQHNSVGFHAKHYQIPAFTLETSYHFDSNLQLLSPPKWQTMGKTLCELCISFFYFGEHGKSKEKPRVSSGEIVWKNWDMISLPNNVEIEEDGRELMIKSLGNGSVFISSQEFLSRDNKYTLNIEIVLNPHPITVELIQYFYSDKIVFERFSTSFLLVESGRNILIPPAPKQEIDYTTSRVAFRIRNIEGNLRVGLKKE